MVYMVNQLVMNVTGGDPAFSLQGNPNNISPLKFERPNDGVYVPRLGSPDIVRLANFASSKGYRLENFKFATANAKRIDSATEKDLSKQLISTLKARGLRGALDLLDTDLQDYIVLGVKLVDPKMNAATIQRHGVVEKETGSSIIDLLAKAWTPLRLA